ncbi:hypothetical protein BH11ACT2_BH11ACT2_15140 [soil metagenome]
MIIDLPAAWSGATAADSPVVVFGNSLGTLRSAWSAQVEHLSSRARVLTFDLPGHVRDGGAFDFDDIVESVAALLKRNGVQGAIYCGVSLGGALGVALAARHPVLVSTLVVINAPIAQSSAAFWLDRADAVERDGLGALADSLASRWFTPEAPAEMVDPIVRDFRSLPPRGYAASCRALATLDVRADAESVSQPTTVLSGVRDLAVDPANSRELVAAIPGAVLRSVDAPHLLPVERADELDRVLDEILVGLDRPMKESVR